MIPEINKKYGIACLGPYDYNRFGGVGIYTGERKGSDDPEDPFLYGFSVMGDNEPLWFLEEEIICEAL